MNFLKRYHLKKQQRELMKKRDVYEQLQTEHSKDVYFYEYTQRVMDSLDEKAEQIRGLLEGRWDK